MTAKRPKDRVQALDLRPLDRDALSPTMQAYYAKCEEKLGFIPNVLLAYGFNVQKLENFIAMSDETLLARSGVSRLERELIAVVVSSINHCYYCIATHGARVREMSGDPQLGEIIAMNYRAAELSPKQRTMLDFAAKLTETPHIIGETDRQSLRDAGWSDADIWDIAATAAFFNMSNRMASAVEMRPNDEYHKLAR